MAFRGELLKAWRESRNMTQCAAARELGIAQPFLRNLECTAKLILYTKGVKVRQDIIVFST